MTSSTQTAGYFLAVFVAIGVMANLILGLWRSAKRLTAVVMPLKVALILTDLGHVCSGTAILMLLRNQEVSFDGICAGGGFLLIFSSIAGTWTLAASVVVMLLWQRSIIFTNAKHDNVQKGTVVTVGALASIWLFSAILAFFPLFRQDVLLGVPYTLHCVPLRLPGQPDWAHTLLELILVCLADISCLCGLGFISVQLHWTYVAIKNEPSMCAKFDKRLRFVVCMLVAAILDVVVWSVVILSAIIVIATPASILDVDGLQWTTGYLVAFGFIGRAVSSLVLSGDRLWKCLPDENANIVFDGGESVPKTLHDVKKLSEESMVGHRLNHGVHAQTS